MEHWELVARESIRDLVARYNANGDTGRFQQVIDLFAPDGVLETDGVEHVGRDRANAVLTAAADRFRDWSGQPIVRHFTTTLQIDVTSPTEAHSRCYFQVLLPQGVDHWGRYVDDFGVVDGRWVFTRRRVIVDGTTEGGWAATEHT